MVKLTALQCAPLLLSLAHAFILPPPDLFSAFRIENTDNTNNADLLPSSPNFASKTDTPLNLPDVYEKLKWLVTSRFDALEQKVGAFQAKIKGQLDGILTTEKTNGANSLPWDSDKEITSFDALRYWDVEAWLQPESESEEDLESWHNKMHHDHPHDGDHDHHRDRDHKHHHHDSPPAGVIEPESTLLDIIKQSPHSEKFYSFIKDFPEIVKALGDKDTNYTVFVPSNRAFEHLLRGKKKEDLKIPKEFIEKILQYHIVGGYHDYDGLKWHNTIASVLTDSHLGKDEKQRLRLGLYRCPTVNLYSKILVRDYIGKNGVIHAVSSILLPPPEISKILNLLPTGFSTTLLALHKTGLIDTLSHNNMLDNPSKYTVFAPPNSAWEKIPMGITAFLFSEYGKEYLEAVMKYHIVENKVIYSDGIIGDGETHFPAGYHHVTAASLLAGKNRGERKGNGGELNIDITRFPGILSFRVNGYSEIVIANGVAKDGVIHVPNNIFMVPCQDLPHHGHHDLKRDLGTTAKRGFLDGWDEGMVKDESESCLDFSVEMEDNEETLEKFKKAWEPFL